MCSLRVGDCEVIWNQSTVLSFRYPDEGDTSEFVEHHRDAYVAREVSRADSHGVEVGVGPLTNGRGPVPPFPH